MATSKPAEVVPKNNEKNLAEALKSNYNVMKRRFLEMVEELKMRRKNDQETEIKINTLLTEKFESKRRKEEEIMLLQKEVDDLKQQNLYIQKEFEDKMKLYEEDKTSQSMSINSSGQGIKALKDEILSLQLAKYSLEKKIKDQEHQLQAGAREREDINKRIVDCQKTLMQVQQGMEELNARLKYLSDLVVKTEAMHQNMVDTNSHHKCLVLRYESTIENLQKELTTCKAEILQRKKEITEMNEKRNHSNVNTHKSSCIENDPFVRHQLQNELQNSRKQKEFIMTSLTESNRMLAKIKYKNDILNELNLSYQLELDELKTERETLLQDLAKANEDIALQQNKTKDNEEKVGNVESTFNTNMQALEADNPIFQVKIASLEENNGELKEKINSLETQQEASICHNKEQPTYTKDAILQITLQSQNTTITPSTQDALPSSEFHLQNAMLQDLLCTQNEISNKPCTTNTLAHSETLTRNTTLTHQQQMQCLEKTSHVEILSEKPLHEMATIDLTINNCDSIANQLQVCDSISSQSGIKEIISMQLNSGVIAHASKSTELISCNFESVSCITDKLPITSLQQSSSESEKILNGRDNKKEIVAATSKDPRAVNGLLRQDSTHKQIADQTTTAMNNSSFESNREKNLSDVKLS